MAIKLTKPLSLKNATHEEQQMLQNLQGNILKGHGRESTISVFFKIDPAKAADMGAALREIANFHITSASKQFSDTAKFQTDGTPGDTFVGLMLSAVGYDALDKKSAAPTSPPFAKGMKKDTNLGDLPVSTWEKPFQDDIHGTLLIADTDLNRMRIKRDDLVTLLKGAGATIVHQQSGSALKNKAGKGIEHFGYVDGRSQPLMLVEDIDKEIAETGNSEWDPEFSLAAALVADPGVGDAVSFGSFFIFRKLEQDVRGFKRREQELADALNLAGDARELAGALAVGRFEDGTPVTLADEAKGLEPPNNFTYKQDSGRCPVHAHIRKVNPRGTGGFEPESEERKHIMPRRGIPYEDKPRLTHPSTVPESASLKDFDKTVGPLLPTGDVGLLFMAYNHDLATQFQFTQQKWANSAAFPKTAPTGIDPVIGVGTGAQQWHKVWDKPASGNTSLLFQGFVKMRGGEYFFAPSLAFLRGL